MAMTTMTSRERMLAALRREKPDHVPFSPYLCLGPLWKGPLLWYQQLERAERMLELGLDPIIEIWMPDAIPHADVEIHTRREESGGEILLTKEYHTPAGVLRQVVRETPDWTHPRHGPWIPTTLGVELREEYDVHLFDDWNVSRRLEPWVKGPEDLDKLRYLIRLPEGYLLHRWWADTRRAMEFARQHEVLTVYRRTIVGDAYQWFCDIPWFMMQLCDNPPFVEEFFEIFREWSLQQVDLAIEVGVDATQYRGWYETPPFWSPSALARHILPHVRTECDRVHAAGKLHTYLLPEGHGAFADVLHTVDTDVLQGVDPRMLHGGDLDSLFAQFGSTKAFWGGVNAEVTLQSRDRRVIDAAVRQAIEALGGHGGLVLSAFLFPDVPQESVMMMIEAWRKYC